MFRPSGRVVQHRLPRVHRIYFRNIQVRNNIILNTPIRFYLCMLIGHYIGVTAAIISGRFGLESVKNNVANDYFIAHEA